MKLWRIVFITVLLSIYLPRPAHACSCAVQEGAADALARSAAVFRGTPGRGENHSGDPWLSRKIPFEVHEVWKGDVSETVYIFTGSGGGDCGYGFRTGAEYIVYAYQSDGGLATSICNRTRLVTTAAIDLLVLGDGSSTDGTPSIPNRAGLWLALLAVGIGAVGFAAWRKRRSAALSVLL